MDAGSLAGAVLPYLTATVAAYGRAVVEQVTSSADDAAADRSVRLGRRLLGRLLTSARTAQVQEAVTELGEHPDDDSGADLLRAQVRKALTDDAQLHHDITDILAGQGQGSPSKYTVNITGAHGVQIGDSNVQHNTFG
ncbi:RIP homotypic interaction motif-containing protein [Paractinoplanes hotanensis]|uniref:Uncharacterized protein n=1 Tax=Paractinoplanes hotanensis TaxID=2906497 RepID=A0ABT0Y9R3_9ACTN|nr:RIP homotypic interaction motif-containing protein [Actinoplanes hotanensis]MCM4082784.1 hypothetical protein [Actinoplanes hotanensis]